MFTQAKVHIIYYISLNPPDKSAQNMQKRAHMPCLSKTMSG